MKIRLVILALTFWVGSLGYAGAEQWKLPPGMVWHSVDGCSPVANLGYVKVCKFGPKGSFADTGAAYFRICSPLRESQPFLTIDIVAKTYVSRVVYLNGQEIYESGPMEGVDPIDMFINIRDRLMPCDESGESA